RILVLIRARDRAALARAEYTRAYAHARTSFRPAQKGDANAQHHQRPDRPAKTGTANDTGFPIPRRRDHAAPLRPRPQALDSCEPVPENNGVGEIEREAALAACLALIGWKDRRT